ncbi:uncharacterized protein si:dkey-220k22.3 [Trichomycterus rosablanca]|uniref:uncharacterized protein si:dkey-220k22.3 n=1 Tax=Trichomycterus rosablanca TaxID=2290929 RepID=UPI002F354282
MGVCSDYSVVNSFQSDLALHHEGTAVVDMFRVLSSKAHVLLKVKNTTEDGLLVWEDEWRASKILLDETETWITVKERGVYLIFIQVTYALVKDGDSTTVDLKVIVDLNFTENRQQFAAAFDTRHLSSADQDAHLTSLFLIEMKAGEKISVSASPKKWISTEPRPFCSFITIVRYADW